MKRQKHCDEPQPWKKSQHFCARNQKDQTRVFFGASETWNINEWKIERSLGERSFHLWVWVVFQGSSQSLRVPNPPVFNPSTWAFNNTAVPPLLAMPPSLPSSPLCLLAPPTLSPRIAFISSLSLPLPLSLSLSPSSLHPELSCRVDWVYEYTSTNNTNNTLHWM